MTKKNFLCLPQKLAKADQTYEAPIFHNKSTFSPIKFNIYILKN